MAFGRLERNAGSQPMSDINMTPLIDVMLVLLVIFIVTAPLMTSSLKLDLPRSEAGRPGDARRPCMALAVDAQGRLYVADQPVDAAQLSARVREAAREGSADRGAAARRQRRALRPRGRADRPRAGRRPVAHRLRDRG
jgi:biopolymer transport protein TolR